MSQRDRSLYVREVEARLTAAAEAGQVVEIIVVLRGRIVGLSGKPRLRWRIRTRTGRVVVVRPETLLAITPVAPRAKRRARAGCTRLTVSSRLQNASDGPLR